jgi:hypothetical protein
MMASDGIFKWYWGSGPEPECMWGAEDTRDAILRVARLEAGGPFLIQCADKALPSTSCFDADQVIEQYEEHNEGCWGEDGAEVDATPEQKRELEAKLADCLDRWMRKHGAHGRAWSFGVVRHSEFFDEQPAEASA